VRDKNIEKPIAIIVGESHTHSLALDRADSCLLGHIRERASPVVAIQSVRQWREAVGLTVTAAVQSHARRLMLRVPLAVIRYEQVEQPIVVVIEPSRRNGPHLSAIVEGAAQAGFRGNVAKRPVTIVMKKAVSIDIGE